MIRQAILCDICGTEMLHPNHWFVAGDHGQELRVSRWDSRRRLRPGVKHLCGQTCLHKLVDEFTARSLNQRVPPSTGQSATEVQSPRAAAPRGEMTLASSKAFPVPALPVVAAACFDDKEGVDSSARLLTQLEPPSRSGHAEAWKRERERQKRPEESQSARHRSIA